MNIMDIPEALVPILYSLLHSTTYYTVLYLKSWGWEQPGSMINPKRPGSPRAAAAAQSGRTANEARAPAGSLTVPGCLGCRQRFKKNHETRGSVGMLQSYSHCNLLKKQAELPVLPYLCYTSSPETAQKMHRASLRKSVRVYVYVYIYIYAYV